MSKSIKTFFRPLSDSVNEQSSKRQRTETTALAQTINSKDVTQEKNSNSSEEQTAEIKLSTDKPKAETFSDNLETTWQVTTYLIEERWNEKLSPEFSKPYFKRLADFVQREMTTKTVFPPKDKIFNAFNLCPFDDVKVLICS
jgi:hypothetical protein